MTLTRVIGYVAAGIGVVAVLWGVDRVLLWIERRGWIYWRRSRGASLIGNPLAEFQKFVQPQVRHVIEMKEEGRVRRDDREGQDDGTGGEG